MRFTPFARRAALGLLAIPLVTACTDELPTATGEELFPGSARPITVELLLEPEEYLLSDTVYTDFTRAAEAGYMVAANRFDGVLDAHGLALFTPFPDSVTYSAPEGTNATDDFEYTDSRILALVNSHASTSGAARLRLWVLDQAWDTAGVSWTAASGGESPTSWTTPGGTRGTMLAEAVWTPGDTIAADTVTFEVDSAAVVRMTQQGYHGILVTNETEGSRVEMSRLLLQAGVRPDAHPDTVVNVTVAAGPQTFIYTPQPDIADAYRIGGVTGDRAVLTLDLGLEVPGCAEPEATPNCPMVPLGSVMINQARLLLEPVGLESGFRPILSPALRVRRVLEPELGRLSALGELIYGDTVPASHFAEPGQPLTVDIGGAYSVFISREMETLTLALMTSPEGGQFGYIHVADRPRLRLVYTLPLRPTFP